MISIYTSVRPGISDAFVRRALGAVLGALGASAADVSVHFVGDQKIRTLNRRYRGRDAPTDVLSFRSADGPPLARLHSDEWGDIFLSVPCITRQARRFDVRYQEELSRMLIHGVLHLAGYDHIRERDARKMFALQEKFVDRLCKRIAL